jgi:hypothetical protein
MNYFRKQKLIGYLNNGAINIMTTEAVYKSLQILFSKYV